MIIRDIVWYYLAQILKIFSKVKITIALASILDFYYSLS